MIYISVRDRADFARADSMDEKEVYQPELIDSAGLYG
jgi:hypothetical protein